MMSLRRPGHFFALFVLVYVTADFSDPFTPGVFFFDKDAFFVDGAVQVKSDITAIAPAPTLIPSGNPPVRGDDGDAAPKVRTVELRRPQPIHWTKQKRDDSASFGSPSPPDPAPSPLS